MTLYKIYHVQDGWPEYLETEVSKEVLEKLIPAFDDWTPPKGTIGWYNVATLVLFLKEKGIEAKAAEPGVKLKAHLR